MAALVQTSATTSGAAGSITLTLPAASTAGNLLVAAFFYSYGTATAVGPAGWVRVAYNYVFISGASKTAELWYYPNNPGGITTATFTFAGGGASEGGICEFSGIVAAPLDQSGQASSAASPLTVSTAAGSTAGDVAVAYMADNDSASIIAGAGGWTTLFSETGNGYPQLLNYQLGAPGGVVSEQFTATAARSLQGIIATFKAAGGGGSAVKNQSDIVSTGAFTIQ